MHRSGFWMITPCSIADLHGNAPRALLHLIRHSFRPAVNFAMSTGTRALAEVLKGNSTLQHLDLNCM